MATSSTFVILRTAVALGAVVLVAPIDTGYAGNEPKAVRPRSDSQGYRYQAPRYPSNPGCHHRFCAQKVRDYRTKPVVRGYRTKTK